MGKAPILEPALTLTIITSIYSHIHFCTSIQTLSVNATKFEFFSYTDKFKYLGTIFTPSQKDDLDICRRINQVNGAFALMKRVLCNKNIPAELRVQLYDATVINILLWGCESWASTKELRRKLEDLSPQISKENGRYHNI